MKDSDRQVVREIAREVSKEITKDAVAETLTQLGFDVKNPLEVQKDIAYLAALRKGAIAAKVMAWRAAITVFIPTMLFLMVRGAIEWIKKNGGF